MKEIGEYEVIKQKAREGDVFSKMVIAAAHMRRCHEAPSTITDAIYCAVYVECMDMLDKWEERNA